MLRTTRSALLTALLAVGLAAPLVAQGGGFFAHDLYVLGQWTNPASHYGIQRVDPFSANVAAVADVYSIVGYQGTMAFDPYRQRLIFTAQLAPNDPPVWEHALLADASGALTPIVPYAVLWSGISPVGDGRIYFHDHLDAPKLFKWLDAANQIHVLYESDGVTPFSMEGVAWAIEDMIYVASQNALITVTTHPSTPCPGGNASRLTLRKFPLSADGTRVVGPTTCNEVDMDPNDLEASRGMTLMSDGDILLGAHNGDYGPLLPRLIRVHPSDLSTATFASFGDDSNGGTGWSTALNRAVVQSHFHADLVTYFDGQANNGAQMGTNGDFPNTYAEIEEIPFSKCTGGWIAYDAGLAGTGGLVPRLYGSGCPQIGGSFSLKIDQVVGGAGGSLFVGLAKASVPFKGGSFLVGAVTLNVVIGVGGAGSLTLPAGLPNNPLLQGVSVYMQAAFNDLGAVKKVSLTQGLELEIG